MPLGTCTIRCLSASNVNARINDGAATGKKGILNLVCKSDDEVSSSTFVLDDVAQTFSCTTAPAIIRGVQGNADENSGISKQDLDNLENELNPSTDDDYINGKKLFPRLTFVWNPSLTAAYNWNNPFNNSVDSMSGAVNWSGNGIYSATPNNNAADTLAFYEPQLPINTNAFYIEYECINFGNAPGTPQDPIRALFCITSRAAFNGITNNSASPNWILGSGNTGLRNSGTIIWYGKVTDGTRELMWEDDSSATSFTQFPVGVWPGDQNTWLNPGLIVQMAILYDPALTQTQHVIEVVIVYNGVVRVIDRFTAGNKTSLGNPDTDVFLATNDFALPAIDDLRFGMILGISGSEAPQWRIPLVKSTKYHGTIFTESQTTPWLVN